MATIAEMFVDIGADASQFERETQRMQQDMRGLQSDMRTMAADMGTSSAQMGRDWQHMSNEMKNAFRDAQTKMLPFKKKQQEIKYEFFQMARGMKNYSGTNKQFMSDLEALGKKHKKITEDMMRANEMQKTGFITGVAAMLARSGQSSKIADNFKRMGNPLYTVNNGLLRVSEGLSGIARRGAPAVLALKMLGPTADMKKLNDMTMMIGQGIMRMGAVAMVGLGGTALLFTGLAKAAMKSVPGYKEAVGQMGGAVREAFQPMVDVFAAVTKPIINLITHIAKLAVKFNEAHPTLAKIIQGFLMLIPLLMLILSPLAIGIGLFAGMQAALNSVWIVIGPLIEGLAAMMGTVLIVAAAIAIFTAAIIWLWKNNEGFRNAVIGIWNAIKAAAIQVWNAISQAVQIAVKALTEFANQQLGKLKAFWDQNGADIQKGVAVVWGYIKAYIKGVMNTINAIMSVAWPAIKFIIQGAWDAIKVIIGGAIDIVLGIIKTFIKLFKGDWSGAWESIKGVAKSYIGIITGLFNTNFVQTIISAVTTFVSNMGTKISGLWTNIKSSFTNGASDIWTTITDKFNGIVDFITGLGTSFYNAGKGLIDMMVKGIKDSISKVTDAMGGLASKARDFLPFSPAKTGPLSDLDKLDFGGPIADSINGAVPKVQKLMTGMLQVPKIGGNESDSPVKSGNTFNFYPQKAIIDENDITRQFQRMEVLYGG